MPWGHEIRQELTREEEDVLIDAVYNKYCVCFSSHKKGIVMRSVRHELKKMNLPAGVQDIRHFVLLTRARFW